MWRSSVVSRWSSSSSSSSSQTFRRRRPCHLAVLMLCCHHHPAPVAPYLFQGQALSSSSLSSPLWSSSSSSSSSSQLSSTKNPQRRQQQQQQQLQSSRRYYFSSTTLRAEHGNGNGSTSTSISTSSSANNHLPRLYVDAPKLAVKTILPLTPAQSNYLNVVRLTNVKRWGPLAGHLRIFNGSDGEWLAKLLVTAGESPEKKRRRNSNNKNSNNTPTVIECLELQRPQPPTPSSLSKSDSNSNSNSNYVNSITLHMGRIKKPRRKWVLEKVTELGISAIDVIDTEYTTTIDSWEHDKHFAQIVEAAEQCERLTLPQLTAGGSCQELVDRISLGESTTTTDEDHYNHCWLICRERSPSSRPILQALQDLSSTTPNMHIHLLVGPEGGWSPHEMETFEQLVQSQDKNVKFVSLGSLVLRAETAAIAAVSAVVLSQPEE